MLEEDDDELLEDGAEEVEPELGLLYVDLDDDVDFFDDDERDFEDDDPKIPPPLRLPKIEEDDEPRLYDDELRYDREELLRRLANASWSSVRLSPIRTSIGNIKSKRRFCMESPWPVGCCVNRKRRLKQWTTGR
ncbi:hypothetical protein [Desulfovibrio inopinatus]|uniref:hypothetical protein n=1 Tax=Desulfovibrio inopinatus TaxID=102109 RepID=UPI0004148AE0|nr:hypothetical protein [Desulfovibrio inopinatus]